jgi:hypothetical protein
MVILTKITFHGGVPKFLLASSRAESGLNESAFAST